MFGLDSYLISYRFTCFYDWRSNTAGEFMDAIQDITQARRYWYVQWSAADRR